MALAALSLINYGLEVTSLNSSLDFKNSSGGSEIQGTLNLGYYSVTGLANEIANVLNAADPANIYTVTVDRTILGGTQNRITISSSGTFLSLLFGTGSRASTSIASLAGFNASDYTGSTGYTGSQTCGTALIPAYNGYSYSDDSNLAKLFGAVSVAASGLKESIVFNIQNFIQVRFKYELKSQLPVWNQFFLWAIQQRAFDFTPEISSPSDVYQVTLEMTEYDSKGLGYQMKEMLPDLPNRYDTGMLTFRIIPAGAQFI